MDLFDYAQALFNQQGDLWLPGLGHFSKVRKSSYYDVDAGVLHPPGYIVGFQENQENTDTALIAYFSSVKNLSQGSAKYFVDKFVENIKDELQTRDINFASLGTLFTGANQQIGFRGNDLDRSANGALYGLYPVNINKVSNTTASSTEEVADTEPVKDNSETRFETLADADQETHTHDPIGKTDTESPSANETEALRRPYEPRDFYADDRVVVMKGKPSREEKSNRYQFWILAALVAIVVVLGIYLVTQNLLDPANSSDVSKEVLSKGGRTDTTIHISKAKNDSMLVHSQDIKSLPPPADTTLPKQTETLPSTAEKPAAIVPVTAAIPKGSWLLTAGQNNNYNALSATLTKFRQMGYPEARMLDSVKKPAYFVYKIIFGYYTTRREAASARSIILKDNKIKPAVLKVQQYNQ